MRLDNNQEAFFELVRAGLWEKEARLSQYKDIDYAAILQLAEEQSVVGLVTAGLEHVSDVKVPQEELLQFIGSTLQIEEQNKSMNVSVAKLMEKLQKENVYVVLVKGQGIAQCYTKPHWRTSGDIDLLLNESNYEKAKMVLIPFAVSVDKEYTSFKHLGMTMEDGIVVELHGTMHSRMAKRIDRVIDNAQKEIFNGGNVRSWNIGGATVYLPAPNVDVILVFTHILRHFFFEGIGLRQICDWCRLLWTYRGTFDVALLEQRLSKMGLMTEWKAFAAFGVNWLGIPVEAMPLYSADNRWSKKAVKICADVLNVGNFGHKQRKHYGDIPYLLRKFLSSLGRLSDMLRHFSVFPKDSIIFLGGVVRTGIYAAVRGE